MRAILALAFVGELLFGRPALAGDDVLAEEPIPVVLPAATVAGWNDVSIESLRAVEDDGTIAEFIEPPAFVRGRLDVLVRRSGRWRLALTSRFEGRLPRLPADEPRVGLLVRVPGRAEEYGWTEIAAGTADSPVRLRWFKNVAVAATKTGGPTVLYVDGEDEPFLPDMVLGRQLFRFVPHRVSLACEFNREFDRCGVVPEVAVGVSSWTRAKFRILHSGSDRAEILISGPGVSLIRPRTIQATVLRAGRHLGVGLNGEEGWADVVADIALDGACQVRIDGASAGEPPRITDVPLPSECGLRVRPRLLPDLEALNDTDARLVFLPEAGEPSSRIAMAVASGDREGVFFAPTLPPGRYKLKLLSSFAGTDVIPVPLEAGAVQDVRFPPGRLVRGRLLQSGGVDPARPPSVQVIGRVLPTAANSASATERIPDPIDLVREVVPERDGRFSFALSRSGSYELSAVWGKARANLTFKLQDATRELDLGDIVLRAGGNLRGRLSGCEFPAEIRVMSLPDLSRPPGPAPFEYLRFLVAPDGSFAADGLPSGSLLVGASCKGTLQSVSPRFISMTEDADQIVELIVVPAPGPSPK